MKTAGKARIAIASAALLGLLATACAWGVESTAAPATNTSKPLDEHMLADIEAIRSVLVLYTKALDGRDYAALSGVFTADATGNYSPNGTYKGLDNVAAFIKRALDQCERTQHLLSNMDVSVSGNTATANSYLQAIHVGKKSGYEGKVMTFWGVYHDRLVRTPSGWRISYRELEKIHAEGDIGMKL